MARMYRIDEGYVFEGTLEQFQDCFFSNATEELIEQWCADQGMKFQAYDTIDPLSPDENPNGWTVAGYSNVTAIHPTGSYIGWSRGPTVFAGPLVYMSEADERVQELTYEVEDAKAESVRQMLKDVVAEAQHYRDLPDEQRSGILHACNIPSEWFKRGGRWVSLTNEGHIDGMDINEVKRTLALFIASCYQQR